MAHLQDVCDPVLVDAAISEKLVSVQMDGRLRISTTRRGRRTRGAWNEATVACRGLILDDDDRIVARPFPKFFGPSEPDAPAIPSGRPMEITTKLDGSLGIAYTHPEGEVRLATRGSLTSHQAIEATRIWHEKYSHVIVPEGVTPPVRDHLPRQPCGARLRRHARPRPHRPDRHRNRRRHRHGQPRMARAAGRDSQLRRLRGASGPQSPPLARPTARAT